jgi:hypothetical protein
MALAPVITPLLPLLLWLCYLSLLNAGGWERNYGWDWLTLEVGFLVIFLYPFAPLVTSRPFFIALQKDASAALPAAPLHADSAAPVIYLLRALAFRLLFGAGMSKLGGSSSACWLQLSCTTTHYSTQPMPNPLSWWAHTLPPSFHRLEVRRVTRIYQGIPSTA